jgi:hypothetical protein
MIRSIQKHLKDLEGKFFFQKGEKDFIGVVEYPVHNKISRGSNNFGLEGLTRDDAN